MQNRDFTTTITLEQTRTEVYNAINNVRGWWSENIEGSTDEPDSEYYYHFRDVHRCTIKIVELIPNEKVVWLVKDNYFSFIKDKTEWIGTKIIFDISTNDNKTEVRFTHKGLVPENECYGVCNEAWTHYIHDSLKSLIETGSGQPSPKEGESFDTEMVEKWELEK